MKITAGSLFLGLSIFLHSAELISSAVDHPINSNAASEHPANENPANEHPVNSHSTPANSVDDHSVNGHSEDDHSELDYLLNDHSVYHHSIYDHPTETTLRKLFPKARSVADFPPLREIHRQLTDHLRHFKTLNGQHMYGSPDTYFVRGDFIVGWKKGNSDEPQHLGTMYFQEYPFVVFDMKTDQWYELKYSQFVQLIASPALAQLVRDHDISTLSKRKRRNEQAHYEASWTAYREVRLHAKYQSALKKVGVESKPYGPGTEKKLYQEVYDKQYRKSVGFQHKYGF